MDIAERQRPAAGGDGTDCTSVVFRSASTG